MDLYLTAIGRLVPLKNAKAILEDDILFLLLRFGVNRQNPDHLPMKLSDIAQAVSRESTLVLEALESLKNPPRPLVEECAELQQERAFRLHERVYTLIALRQAATA